MKKLKIFSLFFLLAFNAIAASFELSESEILELKDKSLLGDPNPSKALALYYDYHTETQQDKLNAAIYYCINGKYGDVRSTLRSQRIMRKYFKDTARAEPFAEDYLSIFKEENKLLKDFFRYRISAPKDVDYELKAYLESKNVHPNLLDEDKVILLRYSVNDTANLLEGESEVLYDLLIQANPVAIKRFFFNPNKSSSFRDLGGEYICSILKDEVDLFSDHQNIPEPMKKRMLISSVGDIFASIKDKDLEELKAENSLFSNFVLMQYYFSKGDEPKAEIYKNFLKERNIDKKLLKFYEIKDGKINISTTK